MNEKSSNIKSRPLFLATIIALVSFSCIPQAKLRYLQDPVIDKNIYHFDEQKATTICTNDELYIKVASLDDVAFNFFSTQGDNSKMGFSNELSVYLLSYSVNDSGYIYFPILGNIYMENLTLEEARIKLEKMLSEYFNQPTVIIKFAFKKVSVLGEVGTPGSYTYTKDHLNVFEALSLAGDITLHGNRNEVYLIRVQGNEVLKQKLDLTKDAVLLTNSFFLKSDDIIYVEPRSSLKWSAISTPISLLLSALTTAILILNYVGNN